MLVTFIFVFAKLVLYSTPMNKKISSPIPTETLKPTVKVWRDHIQQLGLTGLVENLLTIGSPLAPLGAQLLYIAQPVLGLFGQAERVDDWATILDNRAGLDWLKDQLVLPEDDSAHGK